MHNQSLPTIDEIVNTLQRSYLPTILIEGTDDIFVYRWLKSRVDYSLVSLQACGGRNSLFSIHDRKNEFLDKNVIFVADKDAFRFDGIPKERESIIFTSGYCIENDIFEGSNILSFIDDEDEDDHNLLREIIGKWFAFQLNKYYDLNTESQCMSLSVATHINTISPKGLGSICPYHAASIGYSEPNNDLISLIMNEYNLNVRGKQLFQMLSRFLSKKGRFSSFSDKNLIEVALKQGSNTYIDQLVSNINYKLNANQP